MGGLEGKEGDLPFSSESCGITPRGRGGDASGLESMCSVLWGCGACVGWGGGGVEKRWRMREGVGKKRRKQINSHTSSHVET